MVRFTPAAVAASLRVCPYVRPMIAVRCASVSDNASASLKFVEQMGFTSVNLMGAQAVPGDMNYTVDLIRRNADGAETFTRGMLINDVFDGTRPAIDLLSNDPLVVGAPKT